MNKFILCYGYKLVYQKIKKRKEWKDGLTEIRSSFEPKEPSDWAEYEIIHPK